MAAILNVRRQSMRICLKNIPAEFHLDPIGNDGALGFFENGRPNKENNKKKTTR